MAGSTDDDRRWAGDDIPVPDPPAEDDFAATPGRVVRPPVTDGPSFEPLGTTVSPPDASPRWTRRTRLIAGAAIACTAAAAVAVVMVRGGGPDSPESDVNLDPVVSTVPNVSTPEVDRTTAPATSSTIVPDGPRAPMDDRVELPPALAAIGAPTELLLVADDGFLHTLSLPSGVLRSVRLTETPGPETEWVQIVVSPDAVAVSLESDLVIVPREGRTSTVLDRSELSANGLDIVGWRRSDDGQAEFSAVGYVPDGDPRSLTIDREGRVSEIGTEASPPQIQYQTYVAPDGETFVNAVGGVYRLASDGAAERVDEGSLSGLSATHLLLRRCTAELQCGHVLVDRLTGEQRDVPLGVFPERYAGGWFDLSPDGSAASWMLDGPTGAAEQSVVDLMTGGRTSLVDQRWWDPSTTRWAADSSGVFGLPADGSGVDFLDRSTGEIERFAEDLGLILAFGVRQPESELDATASTVTVPISFDGVAPSTDGLVVTALTRSGNVVEVDLDAASAGVWSAPSSVLRSPRLFWLGAEVAVVPRSAVTGSAPFGFVASPSAQRAISERLLGDGAVLAGPAPSTVWTSSPEPSDGASFVLVDLARGERVEPSVSVPAAGSSLLGGDGRGGLVIERGGDIFVMTSESQQRLTTGELLAIGSDTAFVRECDTSTVCTVVRVDRRSGERVALPPGTPLEQAVGIDSSDPPMDLIGSAVAPGGDVALVQMPVGTVVAGEPVEDMVWTLVDVAGGSLVTVDGLTGHAPVVWSSDASSAATLVGSNLVLIERGSGRMVTVNGVGSLAALAGGAIDDNSE